MTINVGYINHKDTTTSKDETNLEEAKPLGESVVFLESDPVYWMSAYKIKYFILILTQAPLLLTPHASDEFRICEDNDPNRETKCRLRHFSIAVMASIFSIQLLAMMPRLPARILITFRVLEIACILGLKVLMQMFQSTINEEQGTYGYLWYTLVCGFITAVLVSEKPIHSKTRRIYDSLMVIVTTTGMATEIALNKYQIVYKNNIAVMVVYVSLCSLAHVCVWIVLQFNKPKFTWGLRSFVEYLTGTMFFAYITMPSTDLLNTSWQVWILALGAGVYTIVFLLSKLSIRYKSKLPTIL